MAACNQRGTRTRKRLGARARASRLGANPKMPLAARPCNRRGDGFRKQLVAGPRAPAVGLSPGSYWRQGSVPPPWGGAAEADGAWLCATAMGLCPRIRWRQGPIQSPRGCATIAATGRDLGHRRGVGPRKPMRLWRTLSARRKCARGAAGFEKPALLQSVPETNPIKEKQDTLFRLTPSPHQSQDCGPGSTCKVWWGNIILLLWPRRRRVTW